MPDERFLRLEQMVGPEGLARLAAAHVVVVGLGAVGSYATEGLARAGVGRLRLVDFDHLRPSNINRQLYALESTLGRRKVDVAAERVLDINPQCSVEALPVFAHEESMEQVLAGPPDLVIDAIDAFNPKVTLLEAVCARGIPALSSMGAALRTDPTRIRVGMLSETSGCPLARRLRRALRRRDPDADVPCVYSDEPVDKSRIRPPGEASEEQPERGRARGVMGSLPTMTGVFGLVLANEALRLLLGDLFPTTSG